jgi:phosphoenolpyruvate carboxylase
MFQQDPHALQEFVNKVGINFQLYNGLFTSLPFHKIEKTGVLLSMLLAVCEDGFAKGESPEKIIDDFIAKQTAIKTETERNDLLFRFIQYAERQVVLFDALEDAAFTAVNDTSGPGTMKHLFDRVRTEDKGEEFIEKLKQFCVQPVLTAHPTQFYPGPVLGIINDTSKAVKENNVGNINMYLQQLGKTPFLNKKKPTPFDEAVSLIWYLENVFYEAAGSIISQLQDEFPEAINTGNQIIKMGFWPGGDRDGNPFVVAETTLQVAAALRSSILRCYYADVRELRGRLTFNGVEQMITALEKKLYASVYGPEGTIITVKELTDALQEMEALLMKEHNGLFIHLVKSLKNKVSIFGLHFATLDVRQESSIHGKVMEEVAAKENIFPKEFVSLSDKEKIAAIGNISIAANEDLYEGIIKDTLQTVAAIKSIQQKNGEAGCNRYIISRCTSALNVMEVYALFLLNGWKKEDIHVDIVPLFETVEDLQNASAVMAELYTLPLYAAHLKLRGNKQTIMLGFSDGTKDGGYLMANWGIYKAKESLTATALEYGVDIVFFDGRGGPPSRGGGKTHRFYSSMGKNIANKEIQVTVQGQTVSSSFGTCDSAKFNIEQLLSAGISNDIFSSKEVTLEPDEEALLQQLADESLKKYIALKEHPNFMRYLNDVSPLRFYSDTNIGSRPAKRGGGQLALDDLRAIPYVGAWSQLKQNVTGYYGVGTAFQLLDKEGRIGEVKALYQNSMFFKTLLENCEMAMKKTWFPLTAFLENHPVYGEIWKMIRDEFELTKYYLLLLADRGELMGNYPVDSLSIRMRERIVLPLSTIQQYAITKIAGKDDSPENDVYKKMVIRSSFGIINAARNAV